MGGRTDRWGHGNARGWEFRECVPDPVNGHLPIETVGCVGWGLGHLTSGRSYRLSLGGP